MTIHGYDLGGARAVKFGEKPASGLTVKSETEITAISPPGIGTVDVTVVTSEGTTAVSSADKFSYFPPPTVTGVQPNSGPTAGGTQVTISGAKFVGVAGVSFGQTAATASKSNRKPRYRHLTRRGRHGRRRRDRRRRPECDELGRHVRLRIDRSDLQELRRRSRLRRGSARRPTRRRRGRKRQRMGERLLEQPRR